MRTELDPVFTEFQARKGTKDEVSVEKIEYAASPLRQMRYVTQRAVKNLIRNPQATILQVGPSNPWHLKRKEKHSQHAVLCDICSLCPQPQYAHYFHR